MADLGKIRHVQGSDLMNVEESQSEREKIVSKFEEILSCNQRKILRVYKAWSGIEERYGGYKFLIKALFVCSPR